jgi:transposase
MHMVDKGYTDTELLARSMSEHGIQLIGPVRKNSSWQAHAGEGFDASQFHTDWDAKQVMCPQGQRSVTWQPSRKPDGFELIQVKFDRDDCAVCTVRAKCTRSPANPRKLVFQPQERQEALEQARAFIGTDEGIVLYREQAGIEGTLS